MSGLILVGCSMIGAVLGSTLGMTSLFFDGYFDPKYYYSLLIPSIAIYSLMTFYKHTYIEYNCEADFLKNNIQPFCLIPFFSSVIFGRCFILFNIYVFS